MNREAHPSLSSIPAKGKNNALLVLTPEQRTAVQALLELVGGRDPYRDPRAATWTYEDLEAHLKSPNLRPGEHRPALALATVTKTIRNLKAVANHPEAPVDLWPPSEESWVRYVNHRILVEKASETVLENPRRALNLLVGDLLGGHWPSLRKPFWRAPKGPRAIPPEDAVPRFWHERLHPDLLQNINLQYIMRALFLTGLRLSDLCALHVQDVHVDEGYMLVTEPKKRGKKRKLFLEPHILSAKNEKSLANYLNKVRPKLLREPTDAFFLSMEGKPYRTHVLRQKLSKAGKRLWPAFTVHCTRARFATSGLLAEYRATKNWNVGLVARKLGDESRTIERHYLAEAEMEQAARENTSRKPRPRRKL